MRVSKYGREYMIKAFEYLKIRKKEGARPGKLRLMYNVRNSKELSNRIWNHYISLVTTDVINGDIVDLTERKNAPFMFIGNLPEKYSNYYLNADNALKNVDLRALNYLVPMLMIRFPGTIAKQDKSVKIPRKKYDIFVKNLEQGKRYVNIPKYGKKKT